MIRFVNIKNSNILMNLIRNGFNILYPIILFPYLLNVIGVDNLSIFDISNSLINYLIIIATFGANIYGVKSLAEVGGDIKLLSDRVQSIVILNALISTFFIGFISIWYFVFTKDDIGVLITWILSFNILFTVLNVDWVFVALEKQYYITYRNVLIKLVTLFLVYLLVNSKEDLMVYVVITVFSTFLSAGVNLYNIRKYLIPKGRIDLIGIVSPMFSTFLLNALISYFGLLDVYFYGIINKDASIVYYTLPLRVFKIATVLATSLSMVYLSKLSKVSCEAEINKINVNSLNNILFFSMVITCSLFLSRDLVVLLLTHSNDSDYIVFLLLLAFLIPLYSINNYLVFQVFYLRGFYAIINKLYFIIIIINIVVIWLLYSFLDLYSLIIGFCSTQVILFLLLVWNKRKMSSLECFSKNNLKIIVAFLIPLLVVFFKFNLVVTSVFYIVVLLGFLFLLKEEIFCNVLNKISFSKNEKN